MTGHHIDVDSVGECVGISEALDIVCTDTCGVGLVEFTVNTGLGTIKSVVISHTLSAAPDNGRRYICVEVLGNVDISGKVSVKLITLALNLVVTVASQRVTGLEECTAYTVVLCSHTVVVLGIAVFVCTDNRIAVLIKYAHVDRIDRSNHGSVVHQVGGTKFTCTHVRVGSGE